LNCIRFGPQPNKQYSGTGSELMRRIAVPMVGGMVSSTLLKLLVIPALYALVKRWPLRRAGAQTAHHRAPNAAQ
jgi:Cu(I)/Ag(I) efflux system membrane protein CusA/SilA